MKSEVNKFLEREHVVFSKALGFYQKKQCKNVNTPHLGLPLACLLQQMISNSAECTRTGFSIYIKVL